jgi:thioredoxin-like negative regulator of GroEL
MAHADTKLAEELEADAIAYPDERVEILLEAADAWQRAGRHDRARAVLDDLIQRGGEYGGDARVQLADLLLQAGDAELAHAQLNAMAKWPRSSVRGWREPCD